MAKLMNWKEVKKGDVLEAGTGRTVPDGRLEKREAGLASGDMHTVPALLDTLSGFVYYSGQGNFKNDRL